MARSESNRKGSAFVSLARDMVSAKYSSTRKVLKFFNLDNNIEIIFNIANLNNKNTSINIFDDETVISDFYLTIFTIGTDQDFIANFNLASLCVTLNNSVIIIMSINFSMFFMLL